MKLNISFKLILFLTIIFQFSCQQNLENKDYYLKIDKKPLDEQTDDGGLSKNHNQIDLSQSTLEQQNIDKQEAATKLDEARKERIEIEIDNSVVVNDEVNVATFARNTINKKGTRVYTRLNKNNLNHWAECSKFKTKDDAQRRFLNQGGPYLDKYNLDPDGDGFACDWDPEVYRELSIPDDY